MKRWARLVFVSLVLVVASVLPASAAPGEIVFAAVRPAQKPSVPTFQAKSLNELYARVNFPNKLATMKGDLMKVFLENVDGPVMSALLEYDLRDAEPSWLAQKFLDIDILKPDGTSQFGDVYITKDKLVGEPKRAGFKEFKLKMTAILFKIIKWQTETKWNESSQTMVTEKVPIYDGGTLISEGNVTIVQEAAAVANGFEDRSGLFAIPYSPAFPKATEIDEMNPLSTPVPVNAFSMLKERDTSNPVEYVMYGFGVETSKLPQKVQTLAGLRDSLRGPKNDMHWGYFVSGMKQMGSGGNKVTVTSTAIAIGTNQGEKEIVVDTGGRALGIIYLLQKGTYTYVFWIDLQPDYQANGTDSPKVLWTKALTEDQRNSLLRSWNGVMGAIKILK